MTAQSRRAAAAALVRIVQGKASALVVTHQQHDAAVDAVQAALAAAHAAGLREGVEGVLALPGVFIKNDRKSIVCDKYEGTADDPGPYIERTEVRALLSPPPAGGDA